MTEEERLEQVILAEKYLGPVFALFGVIESEGFLIDLESEREKILVCECVNEPRHQEMEKKYGKCRPGKHPRRPDSRSLQKRRASSSEDEIIRLLAKFPDTNFAVGTGDRTVVLDVDMKDEKNGIHSLKELARERGGTVPKTVTVNTANRAHHLYFKIPPGFTISQDIGFRPGLDFKGIGSGTYVVAPGSRHITGGYYLFAEWLDPEHQEIAELPAWLHDFLVERKSKPSKPAEMAIADLSRLTTELPETNYDVLPEPGPLRPDKVVLGILIRKCGSLYRGVRLHPEDKSKDDFFLARQLAFYTCHNLDQAIRLFEGSGLYRPKYGRKVKGKYMYPEDTLRRAFVTNLRNWTPSKQNPRPSRATEQPFDGFIFKSRAVPGAKKGRPRSERTLAVLDAINQHSDWTDRQVADHLRLKRTVVAQIRHRQSDSTIQYIAPRT